MAEFGARAGTYQRQPTGYRALFRRLYHLNRRLG
jgi:hypothetical protein